MFNLLKLFFVIGLLFAICGCLGYRGAGGDTAVQPHLVAEAAQPSELLNVNSVLILPFNFAESARSVEGQAELFYSELSTAAMESLSIKVFDDKGLFKNTKWATSADNLRNGMQIAKKIGADAVVFTTLNSFVEREGSRLGAERPAQISFNMDLLRVSDQKSIWHASYFFRDQAVTENLLRVPQRIEDSAKPGWHAGWREADKILAEGLRSALTNLSLSREEQFS
ncbi:MAG: hypothetical protein KDD42_09810 [Bdellovibrionales bacterium]|nr:hypothetical protein [Bdellovibrionales bacterium]